MKRHVTIPILLTVCALVGPSGMWAAGPALIRTDSRIDFAWGDGSPGQGVPADGFSVRWSGSIRLPRDGKYTFYTVSDDGIRLWVDDQLVIDNWTDHGEVENQGQVELWGARSHLIRLEYYENAGAAVAKLLWAGPASKNR